MAYHVVDNFRAGMDRRRPAFAADPGTLWDAINVHLTRGGDVETRKAFIPKYTLPEGTHGLAAIGGTLAVFGSETQPTGMPAGVRYTQCAKPPPGVDYTMVMERVIDVEEYRGKAYVVSEFTDGKIAHHYDGTNVADWFDDRSRGWFTILTGSYSPGVNRITSILVDGVEVLPGPIDWGVSNDETAAQIAATINSFVTTPDYTATSIGPRVIILADAALGDAAGGPIVVTSAGDVTTGDVIDLAFGDDLEDVSYLGGPAVRNLDTKMYAVSGSNLHASGIGEPTEWVFDELEPATEGAGYADVSTYGAGATDLLGLGVFYDQLVVAARTSVQIWDVAADPNDSRRVQSLTDIGLVATRAHKSYRDGAWVFLSDLGVKSLEPRDSSGRAAVGDLSPQIDPILVPELLRQGELVKRDALALVDPQSGRLWFVLGERIYVYNYFPASGVKAWTIFEPGFSITSAAVLRGRIYVRSGDTIYLYGGDDNQRYDADMLAEVVLPYGSMRAPASFKDLHGADFGVEGKWTAYVSNEINRDDPVWVEVGQVDGPTYDEPAIPVGDRGTHFAVKLTHQGPERARLCAVALHFRVDEAGKA